jgi:hypothetical protein
MSHTVTPGYVSAVAPSPAPQSASLQSELRSDLASLRGELRSEIASINTSLHWLQVFCGLNLTIALMILGKLFLLPGTP